MSADRASADPIVGDPQDRWIYRVGGISAVALGIAYVVTVALYAMVGAPPLSGEAWLTYVAGKTSVWWAIVGLAVLTDLLFVPVALSLHLALREAHRGAMALAAALVMLFVVLDLAVTQANFAALITIGGNSAASTALGRVANVAAATYATAVLRSTVGVYSIVVLALGELIIGLVMLRASFSRPAAYIGLTAGALGIISVAGAPLVSVLGNAVIISSVLTMAWVIIVGVRLHGMSRPDRR